MEKSEKKAKQNKKFRTIDIVYVGLFAALMAVCAWIAFPLGEISFTFQTFGVCLVAGLLGRKRGTMSVMIYILLGMVGLPVFTGFKSGIAAITGPTGGYIVGFIFTALIVGFAADKFGRKIWINVVSMIIGLAVMYVFGTLWFMFAFKVSFASAFATCVLPFLIPEVFKIALSAVFVNVLKKFVK